MLRIAWRSGMLIYIARVMKGGPFPTREICISAFAATLPVFILSPRAFLFLFFVTGYAHFASAFLYQWKAGKITAGFGISLGIVALSVGAFTSTAPGVWQIAVAGVLFVAHHAYDEFRLLGFTLTGRRMLEMATPALLFTGAFLASIFGEGTIPMLLGIVAGCTGFGLLVSVIRKTGGYRIDRFSVYTLVLTALAVPLYVSWSAVAPEYLIGIVILYHYSKWYLYSYRRMPQGSVRSHYVRNIISINVIIAAVFLLSFPSFGIPFFAPLFSLFLPPVFYFMTIMHIVASGMQGVFSNRISHASARA